VESLPIDDNNVQRERLAALVDQLTDDELTRTVGDGRTVAAVFAYLAFWDRWAERLLLRWRSGLLPPPSLPDWYDGEINATLLPLLLSLPPRAAGALAVEAALSVDRAVTKVETPVLAAIAAAGETNLLHRHQDRGHHLDLVENALRRRA
jgi:hypothetical protein